MNELLSTEIARLERGFDAIEHDKPFLNKVASAFRDVFISRAILQSELFENWDLSLLMQERSRLLEGEPFLTRATLANLVDPWGETIESAMIPLAIAFPSVETEVLRLREVFANRDISLEYCIGVLVEHREHAIIKIASYIGFQPLVLKFILGQILKPFVEKRTESLRRLAVDLPWHQGYCPVCGSNPELSFILGDDGQRWLKCALCGHEWKFEWTTCPGCGNTSESREFIYIDGFKHEWIEDCHACNRYVLGVDLRNQQEITSDIAAIGMVHLDLIAQSKGLFPMVECAWNMVAPMN